MKTKPPLTMEMILEQLREIKELYNSQYRIWLDKGAIRIVEKDDRANIDDHIMSPLTLAFYHMTERKIPLCFLLPEIHEEFTISEYEIVRISRAEERCETGGSYDRTLRNRMLEALGLPIEKRLQN